MGSSFLHALSGLAGANFVSTDAPKKTSANPVTPLHTEFGGGRLAGRERDLVEVNGGCKWGGGARAVGKAKEMGVCRAFLGIGPLPKKIRVPKWWVPKLGPSNLRGPGHVLERNP